MSKNSVETMKQEQKYKILIRNLRKQQEEKNNETTLGCECKRIESDWKKLISAYLLFIKYGENSFVLSDKVEKEFFPCLLSKNTSGNSILQKDFPCHIMTFPSIYSKMTKVNKK